MVDVRSGWVALAAVGISFAVGVSDVVSADEGGAPVKASIVGSAFEDTPNSSAVLLGGSSVVDDDVCYALNALVVECFYQCF